MRSGFLISVIQTEGDGKGPKNEGDRAHCSQSCSGNDSLLVYRLKIVHSKLKNPIILLPSYLDRKQECFLLR